MVKPKRKTPPPFVDTDSKPNPNCSTLVQGLIELMRLTDCPDDIRAAADFLKTTLTTSNAYLTVAADRAVQSKRYPEERLTYMERSRWDKYPLAGLVTSTSLALFDLLASVADQSGLVGIRRDIACEVLGCSTKTIVEAYKELIEMECIAVYKAHSRYSPTVYLLNPSITRCGKHTQIGIAEYERLLGKDSLARDTGDTDKIHLDSRGSDYRIAIMQIILSDGSKALYGTLAKQEDKAPAPRMQKPNRPDDDPETHTSSIPQLNLNRKRRRADG